MRGAPDESGQGMRQLTLERCSLDFRVADKRIVAASDTSFRIAAALRNLPPLPQVAAQVAALLKKEPTSFRLIAETLKTDAALTAEVLRLSNSPLIEVRYHVTSVMQALVLLGSRRITNLIMTLTLSKLVRRAGGSEAMLRLWRHNLACALAAKQMTKSCEGTSDAYYAGLFHDIGRLALFVEEPAPYDQALREGRDVDEMELSHFGLDHREVGRWVIEKWKLPKAFVPVVLNHHNPGPEDGELTVLVHEACRIANRLGFSFLPVEGAEGELGPADELGFSIALVINSLECEFGI
jgi:HD-like signal output (HDOD) protein